MFVFILNNYLLYHLFNSRPAVLTKTGDYATANIYCAQVEFLYTSEHSRHTKHHCFLILAQSLPLALLCTLPPILNDIHEGSNTFPTLRTFSLPNRYISNYYDSFPLLEQHLIHRLMHLERCNAKPSTDLV